MIDTRVCTIDGCREPHVARGWCNRHYYRWLRTGSPVTYCRPLTRAQVVHLRRIVGVPDDGPDPETVRTWNAEEALT